MAQNPPAATNNANTVTNSPMSNSAPTNLTNAGANANVPTSKTYSNATYGFALEYPATYEFYTGSNPRIGLLFNWGINNIQELLFSINVHPLSQKESMLHDGQLVLLPETHEVGGLTAHKVSRGGLYAVEANGYLYVIDSLYQDVTDAPDKKADFFSILDSITFTTQQ